MKYTYLLLHVLTLAYPLYKSFESKIRYYKKWKHLFPAIFFCAVIFILWDIYFTKRCVWGFNKDYISGIYLFELPIEECMFFFTVPFSCLFIYEVVKYFDKRMLLRTYSRYVSLLLVALLSLLAFSNTFRMYTFTTFIVCSALILIGEFIIRASYMAHFYMAYLFCLIPFFLVNGVLTYLPVVVYNDAENMGLRIISIPFEDIFYGMSLILMNVMTYEWLSKKSNRGFRDTFIEH
ncbi:MAG: lycopene cyclase domain-containing protein [Cytophagaceae bacterium]|nr:lycopene cyclase domain-containing protein [Cytophagaceae bacterium]MDW8456077.1 lycopene cyclase domain-containing protein [Cytophagaceae bacterium]